MHSRLNRSAGMLLFLGTLFAAQSCDRHAPTEITRRGLLPTSPVFDLSPPPLGTYNIPVPPENNFSNNGGSAPWAYTGIRIPGYTAYVITVNGRVSTTKNPAWYCQGTNSWPYDGHNYGPLGTGANYDLLVQLRVWPFSGANSYVPVSLPGVGSDTAPTVVKTDTVFTWYDQDLEAKRNGIAFACDNVGGYLMSGSQTLTVEEITNTFRLTPSEYYVHPGTRVSFTASMADGSPLSTTISWGWIADSLHARTVSNICGQNANPCSVSPTVSGTVRVAGFVLGKGHEAKGHVTVYSQFTLDADKTTADFGDTVTFTPKLDGKVVIANRWRWQPDSASVANRDSTTCVPANQCKKRMRVSGTMWAYLNTGTGAADSAGKHVNLTPCITGDSILDAANIRIGLDSIWQLSHPTLQPPAQRIERGMFIYDSAGKKVFRITEVQPRTPTDPGDDACRNALLLPPGPSPGTLIAEVHTHPGTVGENILCNAQDNVWKEYSDQFGGPSGPDWGRIFGDTQTQPGLQGYVLDATHVYRYSADGLEMRTVTDVRTHQQKQIPAGDTWRHSWSPYPRNVGCKLL